MKWYWKAVRNYANHNGRANRKEFWWFHIINLIITFLLIVAEGVLLIVNPSFGGKAFEIFSSTLNYGVFGTIYFFAVLPAYICVTIRRFHDIGKSGKWYWLFTIPIVSLYCLYLLAKPSVPEINEYGQPPNSVPLKDRYPRYQRTENDAGVFIVDQSTGEVVSERYFDKPKTQIKTSFCRSCGHKLDEESNFCSNCGTRVLREW